MLRADAVPALPGAEEVLAEGIASSLAPSNAAAASAAVRDAAAAAQHARWPLLLDPQTGVVPCSGFPASTWDDVLPVELATGCCSLCA